MSYKAEQKFINDNINNIVDDKLSKITILIAHNDKNVRNAIIKSISNFNYVDIDIATNANETFEKIQELNPQMVFTQYNFETENGIDLITKVTENNKSPIFNLINNEEIPDDEIRELYDNGININAIITDNPRECKFRSKLIVKDFKELLESNL